jgi:hypothetical protein
VDSQPLGPVGQYPDQPSTEERSRVPTLYHGTDLATGRALLAGAPLSEAAARDRKIDGPVGFYLATSLSDAEFFAARRAPGAIIAFIIAEEALEMLTDHGATLRPMPVTPRSPFFAGDELFLSPGMFGLFDRLRREGKIDAHA